MPPFPQGQLRKGSRPTHPGSTRWLIVVTVLQLSPVIWRQVATQPGQQLTLVLAVYADERHVLFGDERGYGQCDDAAVKREERAKEGVRGPPEAEECTSPCNDVDVRNSRCLSLNSTLKFVFLDGHASALPHIAKRLRHMSTRSACLHRKLFLFPTVIELEPNGNIASVFFLFSGLSRKPTAVKVKVIVQHDARLYVGCSDGCVYGENPGSVQGCRCGRGCRLNLGADVCAAGAEARESRSVSGCTVAAQGPKVRCLCAPGVLSLQGSSSGGAQMCGEASLVGGGCCNKSF